MRSKQNNHSYITPNTRASTVKRGVPRYCTERTCQCFAQKYYPWQMTAKPVNSRVSPYVSLLNSFERKSPPLVIRGYEFTKHPPCGFNRFPLDKLTDRLNRLSVFFVSGEKLFNKKALIVLFILVLSCLGNFWLVKSITYNSKNTKMTWENTKWREKTQKWREKTLWKILVF